MNTRRWVIALLILVAPIEALARDPRVPPGRDPGGIAVAIVSTGIDYTQPQIAARLARDGEGEIIGWDFTDGDALPFDTSQSGNGTALASMILAESPVVRLVSVRIDALKPGSFTRALAFIGQTPAQVVLVADGGSSLQDWELIREVARHFTKLLIIMPAEATRPTLDAGAAGLENVMQVAATSSVQDADMIIEPPADDRTQLSPAVAAAAFAASRAAEEAARGPELGGAGLKRVMIQKHPR